MIETKHSEAQRLCLYLLLQISGQLWWHHWQLLVSGFWFPSEPRTVFLLCHNYVLKQWAAPNQIIFPNMAGLWLDPDVSLSERSLTWRVMTVWMKSRAAGVQGLHLQWIKADDEDFFWLLRLPMMKRCRVNSPQREAGLWWRSKTVMA